MSVNLNTDDTFPVRDPLSHDPKVIAGPRQHLAVSGHIAGYDLIIRGNTVIVMKGKAIVAKREVPNYGTAMADLCQRPGFRTGWGRTADFEVIGLYDKEDGNFGYAINLDYPDYDEWTYCYFGGGDDEE